MISSSGWPLVTSRVLYGAVAQLVERLHGMEEVARSIRVSSTNLVQALLLSWCHAGHFFGGLIAGEGSYLETTNGDSFADGEKRKRFIFSLTLASWDRPLVHALEIIPRCRRRVRQTAGQSSLAADDNGTCPVALRSSQHRHSLQRDVPATVGEAQAIRALAGSPG